MIDITIIVENKAGLLSKIAEEFKARGINLADISAHVLGEKGILTLSVEDAAADEGRAILASLGYTPLVEQCLILRLEDRPGALAEAAHILEQSNISIDSLRIFHRKDGEVFIALTTDNPVKTREVLRHFDARKAP